MPMFTFLCTFYFLALSFASALFSLLCIFPLILSCTWHCFIAFHISLDRYGVFLLCFLYNFLIHSFFSLLFKNYKTWRANVLLDTKTIALFLIYYFQYIFPINYLKFSNHAINHSSKYSVQYDRNLAIFQAHTRHVFILG